MLPLRLLQPFNDQLPVDQAGNACKGITMANELYFDETRNLVTASPQPGTTVRVIQKADVPNLVRGGAEVDESARKLNELLKSAERI